MGLEQQQMNVFWSHTSLKKKPHHMDIEKTFAFKSIESA